MGKILVTGGAGYIGSHTVKELLRTGHKDIVVVDDLSNGDKSRVPETVRFIRGDFASREILEPLLEEGVETVMHFAAFKIAPESVVSPEKYYENNAVKSIELLDLCIKNGVKYFIFSSSAAVYGGVREYPITEDFETKPTNPYGRSKLMFEQILIDCSVAHDMRHVSLRYFNAGGADPDCDLGNDHEKGEDLVSALMTSAKNNEDFTIFGSDYNTKDGTCIRDLVHVSDLASAHIKSIEYLENGGESVVINLGSEKGFSVKEVAKLAQIVTNSTFDINYGQRREGDIVVSIASSEKARKLMGWEKKYSDIQTIVETAWNWELKSK